MTSASLVTILSDKSTNSVPVTYGLAPATPTTTYGTATISSSSSNTVLASGLNIPNSSDFVMNFDWETHGGDTPYILLASTTGGYGDPSSGEKRLHLKYSNSNGDISLSSRYNDGGSSEDDYTISGGSTSNNVVYYYQLIKSGNTMEYKVYGSDADRTSQTNEEQTVPSFTLSSAYDACLLYTSDAADE